MTVLSLSLCCAVGCTPSKVAQIRGAEFVPDEDEKALWTAAATVIQRAAGR